MCAGGGGAAGGADAPNGQNRTSSTSCRLKLLIHIRRIHLDRYLPVLLCWLRRKGSVFVALLLPELQNLVWVLVRTLQILCLMVFQVRPLLAPSGGSDPGGSGPVWTLWFWCDGAVCASWLVLSLPV